MIVGSFGKEEGKRGRKKLLNGRKTLAEGSKVFIIYSKLLSLVDGMESEGDDLIIIAFSIFLFLMIVFVSAFVCLATIPEK